MKFDELIQDFSKEDFCHFFVFIKKHFHDKYILLQKDFLTWQYHSKFIKCPSLSIKIIKNKNDFLGYLGLIPLKFKYFSSVIQTRCLANLMIDESVRKIGLGSVLTKSAEKEIDLLYVTGYNSKVATMYEQLGWVININLKRFVYIINNKKVNALTETFTFAKTINANLSYPDLFFNEIYSFDTTINDFWQKIKYKYPITAERSDEYLNWRYTNHPLLKYHLFIVQKKKQIQSFLILRIEEPAGYKIARIIDFVSTDDAEEFTLNKIINYCKKQEVDFIDFFFTGEFHANSLKKLGLVETNKEPYSRIPILFNPINRQRITINFAFKLVNKDLYDDRINDIKNWYITKGDGDQDRPNIFSNSKDKYDQ